MCLVKLVAYCLLFVVGHGGIGDFIKKSIIKHFLYGLVVHSNNQDATTQDKEFGFVEGTNYL